DFLSFLVERVRRRRPVRPERPNTPHTITIPYRRCWRQCTTSPTYPKNFGDIFYIPCHKNETFVPSAQGKAKTAPAAGRGGGFRGCAPCAVQRGGLTAPA